MKPLSLFLFLTVSGFAQSDTAGSLGWLSGHWIHETGKIQIEEMWSQPSGNSLIGWSRTIENGKLGFYEFMIIRRTAAGQFAFIAKPSGQEGAEFPLTEVREGYVVFENVSHDFPQKISYRLVGKDSLIGRIEGTVNGKFRMVEFPYKRHILH
ncbi:MAG: DUF6265 family protein [Bacteroidota bacterium]